jgi:hypothetical protein
MEIEGIQQLVVIGDRPDPNITMHLLSALDRWLSAGTRLTILNRHEANWARVPQLLARGVSVTLGTDWAYFAGDRLTQADILWGRIAALCVRDPTMAAVRISFEEQILVQGFLCTVLDALAMPAPGDTAGWAALAEPLLGRIIADDREFFRSQAAKFVERYATPRTPRHVQGRVLLFDQPPSPLPQALFWTLEAAIEQHGQIAVPGICYHTPYAIARWPEGQEVELVAISHWREEEAIPIRLLYPDIEPRPQGTESSLSVRLATAQSDIVVSELLAACNR